MLGVAGSVAAYHLLPLDHSSTPAAMTILLTGPAGFIVLVAVAGSDAAWAGRGGDCMPTTGEGMPLI